VTRDVLALGPGTGSGTSLDASLGADGKDPKTDRRIIEINLKEKGRLSTGVETV